MGQKRYPTTGALKCFGDLIFLGQSQNLPPCDVDILIYITHRGGVKKSHPPRAAQLPR
jgi:hypothetical protein